MNSSESLLILYLQISAAILMGTDYFFSDSIKIKIDEVTRSYFNNMQSRVDKDISSSIKDITSKKNKLFIFIYFCMAGTVIMSLAYALDSYYIVLGAILKTVSVTLFGVAVVYIFDTAFRATSTLIAAAPFRLLTYVLLRAPKGPLSTIGFFILLLSFYLEYKFTIT